MKCRPMAATDCQSSLLVGIVVLEQNRKHLVRHNRQRDDATYRPYQKHSGEHVSHCGNEGLKHGPSKRRMHCRWTGPRGQPPKVVALKAGSCVGSDRPRGTAGISHAPFRIAQAVRASRRQYAAGPARQEMHPSPAD